MPLFIDATGIEVDGHLFQWVRRNYEGRCGYWLHASFLGGLWTAGQLCPGGGRVTLNWRTLLERTAQALPEEAPVWLRADNAYYKGERVRRCAESGWDYSISVTHDQWLKPVVDQIEGLADEAWTDIGMEEEAIFATHRPSRWPAEQHYVVVRRRTENAQRLRVPRHTLLRLDPRGGAGRHGGASAASRGLEIPECGSEQAACHPETSGMASRKALRGAEHRVAPGPERPRMNIQQEVPTFRIVTAAHHGDPSVAESCDPSPPELKESSTFNTSDDSVTSVSVFVCTVIVFSVSSASKCRNPDVST